MLPSEIKINLPKTMQVIGIETKTARPIMHPTVKLSVIKKCKKSDNRIDKVINDMKKFCFMYLMINTFKSQSVYNNCKN